MGDATYGPKVYMDDQGDRQVVTTGGRINMDGGAFINKVREAAICGSCGTLPYTGTAIVGNSSAAIIWYQLPVPESCYVGSELTLNAIPFDDVINSSTHWRVVATSSLSYAVGLSTATACIVFDSTYEYGFQMKLQVASTNLWKALLPPSSLAGILFSTTCTT